MKQLVSSTKPRVKAGTSKAAAVARRKVFAQAYTSNGRNGTQAAITAGFSVKSARQAACRMLTNVDVIAQVDKAAEHVEEVTALSADRAIALNAHIATFDVRKLSHPDGTPKGLHELDDETATAVTITSSGIVPNDRQRALDMAFKNLGLYERDNAQRAPCLAIQIILIGPEK